MLMLCIFFQSSIDGVLAVGEGENVVVGQDSSDDTDDEDADEISPHQMIIFLVSSLRGEESGSEWMPFTSAVSSLGVYVNNARIEAPTEKGFSGWISALYGATREEYGCIDNSENCQVPSIHDRYYSLLDVLEYDEGYSVEVFSESSVSEPNMLKRTLRHTRPVMEFDDRKLDMMQHGLDEEHLPQTDRRALIFHFSALDRLVLSHGYESLEYRGQVLCIDWQISQLVKSLWRWEPSHTTFALVSNHGGRDYGHREFSLKSLQVPLAVFGYGIYAHQGRDLYQSAISTNQLPATILKALNYEAPNYWRHEALRDCYDTEDSDAQRYSAVARSFDTDAFKPSICPIPTNIEHSHISNGVFLIIISAVFLLLLVPFCWSESMPFSDFSKFNNQHQRARRRYQKT